ncbi:MAG: hypothetical protein ACKO83_11890, partial [Roseiflexaceae bacterium]
MSISVRVLALAVCGLIAVNIGLAWSVWAYLPSSIQAARVAPTAGAAAPPIAASVRPSAVTAECRSHVKAYLDQSSARMNAYFMYTERLTANNYLILADEVLALSKDYAPLPEGCPDTFDTALHMNYLSVYSSAPIHLHRYLSTATDLPRETANMRIAWRFFEREAD